MLVSETELIGKKINKLKVEKLSHYQKVQRGNVPYWECTCECGNKKIVSHYRLLRNEPKSCGCSSNYLEITGQIFGTLTAVEKSKKDKRGSIWWKCYCKLHNNYCIRKGSDLSNTSGCDICHSGREDLVGSTYGPFEVVSYKNTINKKSIWKCYCNNCKIFVEKDLKTLKQAEKNSLCRCIHRNNLSGRWSSKYLFTKLQDELYTVYCRCSNLFKLDVETAFKVYKQDLEICKCNMSNFKEEFAKMNRKLAGTLIGIFGRCFKSYLSDSRRYYVRNISIYPEWLYNPASFQKWAIENGFSTNLTIDRINVNGNYEPSNCRWADTLTQANNRSSNVYLNIKGEKISLADAIRKYKNEIDITYDGLRQRLKWKSNFSSDEDLLFSKKKQQPHNAGKKYNPTTKLFE